MARDLFTDTSGLYALADRRDPLQARAQQWVLSRVSAGGRLVLTDYILDEACTLAKARAGAAAALRLLALVEASAGFRLEWVGPDRFEAAKAWFRKHSDHGYSFTDCTSFVVMRELKIRDALTSDRHFVEAGFHGLLLPE
ncbi:MAG TPA: PIN domain-containing protein [Verrucomicrobiota bacterium]|nr:PIN domain-containing protein [Verrucomicrobiota bacterium]HNU51965.1 PIN domain-containing protein [Verrucomicrobiota bacterium]